MDKIYIDSNYCCHITNINDNYIEIETDFFNGKCNTFIEGYRFIPKGESWACEDGTVFSGEMIVPWKPYDELDQAQRKYERQQLEEAQTALEIILGEVDA